MTAVPAQRRSLLAATAAVLAVAACVPNTAVTGGAIAVTSTDDACQVASALATMIERRAHVIERCGPLLDRDARRLVKQKVRRNPISDLH